MVVTYRTHQLIKTGKSVTISNKFNYSTRNTPLGIKNYVEKNSVPRSNKPKLSLYDSKRFHSSRESRSTLAKLTPQEILIGAPCESKSIRSLSRPTSGILSLILQSRGTSLERISDQIVSADGDLQQVVPGINSELKQDLLVIDGDTLRVDPGALQKILKESIPSILQAQSQNSSAGSLVGSNFLEQLAAQSFQLNPNKLNIPVDNAQQWLQANVISRSKRSLQPKDFDLGQIITDLVTSLLQDQLTSLIIGLLENVKTLLEGLYIVTAPGNDIGNFIASLVNWVIKGTLEIITLLEQTLNNGLTTDTTTDATESRKRREVEVTTDASVSVTDQGLDVLIRPILTILSTVLGPANGIVATIELVLNTLEPTVGTIIITRIRALILAIVDLVLPATV